MLLGDKSFVMCHEERDGRADGYVAPRDTHANQESGVTPPARHQPRELERGQHQPLLRTTPASRLHSVESLADNLTTGASSG